MQAAVPSAHMWVGYAQATFDMVEFNVAVEFINPLSQSSVINVILGLLRKSLWLSQRGPELSHLVSCFHLCSSDSSLCERLIIAPGSQTNKNQMFYFLFFLLSVVTAFQFGAPHRGVAVIDVTGYYNILHYTTCQWGQADVNIHHYNCCMRIRSELGHKYTARNNNCNQTKIFWTWGVMGCAPPSRRCPWHWIRGC